MGTFQGHFLPGAFFFTFGLWWIYQITKRTIMCQYKRMPYYNTVTFPCLCGKIAKWPLEGIFVVIACGIGIVGELFAATDYGRETKFVFIGDLEHVTMYGFFLLGGIIVIIQHYVSSVPYGLDYTAYALAFTAEFVLFKFHLHGREELDILVHTFLLYLVAVCVIATLVELKQRRHPLAGYFRAYATMMQGTWFIQIGFILYNPIQGSKHWKNDDPDVIMIMTMMLCWHLLGGAFFMLLFVFVVRKCYRRFSGHCFPLPGEMEYEMIGVKVSEPCHCQRRLREEEEEQEEEEEEEEEEGVEEEELNEMANVATQERTPLINSV